MAFLLAAVNPILAQCPADVNGDGGVGGTDLSIVLSAWSSNGQGQYDADINNDGIVDGSDLTSLLSAWGNCAPAVPAWATLLEATPNP
ncbi:MAG: GC-type dockerin domain-anchored protein, partial [Planctomycetota bacterium]